MGEPSEPWIERASQGDQRAIEHLLVRYLPDLEGYFSRRGRWGEDAADLVQSVCREVLQHLAEGRLSFRGEPQFLKWLYRAAALKLLEQRRRQARPADRAAGNLPSFGSAEDIGAFAPDSPSQALDFGEGLERFLKAFETLDPRQAQIFRWHHIEGLPHGEIAARLSIEVSHSRTLLARALAKLSRVEDRDSP